MGRRGTLDIPRSRRGLMMDLVRNVDGDRRKQKKQPVQAHPGLAQKNQTGRSVLVKRTGRAQQRGTLGLKPSCETAEKYVRARGGKKRTKAEANRSRDDKESKTT